MFKDMFKINLKNFNEYTILSILFFLAGFILWISWGLRYNVWYDIGIYSITVVFCLAGIVGFFLSLMEKETEN